MANIKLTDVNASAKLLIALAKKVDFDGDGKLSTYDVGHAAANPAQKKRRVGAPAPKATKPTLDPVTTGALNSAILRARARSEFSIAEVQKQIEDVRKKLVTLDTDHNGSISEAELKKIKPDGAALAKALLAFAKVHADDSISDFKVAHQQAGGGWNPSTPFIPHGTPVEIATSLVKHFDQFSNDNRWPGMISRFVLGPDETKAIVAEINKLPKAQAKAVLQALSDQILSDAAPRPYIVPTAVKYIEAAASKVGLHANFKGVSTAPKFPGY